jgi:proline iminopeptidase
MKPSDFAFGIAGGEPYPELYPLIEPYLRGFLEVSGGHRLAYEICGNPAGRPALFLHGGPGAGCWPVHRRFFDPETYKIVLLDQRGAGRSTPAASLEANTTAELVNDLETLRHHLRISRWLVFGGSWGSTLALAYAARHSQACMALVLRGIWLCRPEDLEWWFKGIRMFFPEYWQEFSDYIPKLERNDLLDAYYRRLIHPNPIVHMPAAVSWVTYETRCETLLPIAESRALPGPDTLAMARIESHYMRYGSFLGATELMDSVPRFRKIPAAIVHGRYDMLCPVDGALALAKAWPEARLSIAPASGHSATEPEIRRLLVAATDRFRTLDD